MTPEERRILDAVHAATDKRSPDEIEIENILAGKVPSYRDDPKAWDYPPKLSDEAAREVDLWAKRAERKK